MKAQCKKFTHIFILFFLLLFPARNGCSQEALAWGDVVINEIMADPDPCAGECHHEYVEILNRSEQAVSLDSLYLQVGSRKVYPGDFGNETGETGGEADRVLQAGDFFVFEGMQVSNGSGELILGSCSGRILHWVEYDFPWEGPAWKEEGGWSLEALDPELYCTTSGQWCWSEDPTGGTPGIENTAKAYLLDDQPPIFLYYGVEEGQVHLHFSEILGAPGCFLADFSVQVDGIGSTRAQLSSQRGNEVVIQIPGGMSRRPGFRMELSAVSDCMGNRMQAQSFSTGAVSNPASGTLVVNEIMFQAEEDQQEFIELYHAGAGHTDLSEISVGIASTGEEPDKHLPLSDHSHIIGKGDYLVLCRDAHALVEDYRLGISGTWKEVPGLPTLSASGGKICLYDCSGNSLDVAVFSKEMHMEGMDSSQGISLERIRSEGGGEDPDNWHSAASMEGYCTPGRQNSQHGDRGEGEELLQLAPAVFSPGYDGYKDLQQIEIRGLESGSVLRLWITDLEGREVRTLANNHIAGPAATYTWDGRDGQGRSLKPGFYVIHMEAFHLRDKKRWRQRAASGVIYP